MFGKAAKNEKQDAPEPPPGVTEMVIRVLDEKGRSKHQFVCALSAEPSNHFEARNGEGRPFESGALAEAMSTRRPVALSFEYGNGERRMVDVLPYEGKWGKWRFVCARITLAARDSDGEGLDQGAAVWTDRGSFLLADARHELRSTSARLPDEFGYDAERLQGMNLRDLFDPADLTMIAACSPDTNESILSCVLHCRDDRKRDVEVRKYAAADGLTLYNVRDVTRPNLNEEITQVATRERRRIGQDLHDSIGQMLTGISLLSRSLAKGLNGDENPREADAIQISELADDASNQIRQISRGLMPAEIVHRGLLASLRDLARVTSESCGLDCEAILDETVEFQDGAVETHLFRIAQEAVNNAVRHSGASRVEIVLAAEEERPRLIVRDNGRWRNILENAGGIGLKTMHYRASVINGQFSVQKTEDGGTAVMCRLEAEDAMETKVNLS